MKKLFPPYLDQGSKGTAVDVLHCILCVLGFGERIVRDGEYGEETKAAVKELQVSMEFEGEDIDGNFGPKTREELDNYYDIDVGLIPFSSHYDKGNTWRGPGEEGDKVWDGGE